MFETRIEKAAAEHLGGNQPLEAIRENAAQLLGQVGKHRAFKNYTGHGIDHSERMLALMEEWLIPPAVLDSIQQNKLECLLLVLSAYLHDIGMFVSKDEEDGILSDQVDAVLGCAGDPFSAYVKDFVTQHRSDILAAGLNPDRLSDSYRESVILEAYLRERHAKRSGILIRGNQLPRPTFGARELIPCNFSAASLGDLARLCESHGLPMAEIQLSFPRENPDLLYLASVLRIADLLDLSRERTPDLQMVYLANPSDTSLREWWRHLQTELPQILASNPKTVIVRASFSEREDPDAPVHYRALIDYLNYTNAELRNVHLALGTPRREEEYCLAVTKIHVPDPAEPDSDQYILCVDFSARTYRFELAPDRIIALLMGENIYEKPAIAIREVLLNAIDATRCYWDTDTPLPHRHARIEVKYETTPMHTWPYNQQGVQVNEQQDPYFECHRLIIRDFGIGMTRNTIEQYFCQIGRSYYSHSEEFDRQAAGFTPASRFGVGILSLFMLAKRFMVTTQHRDSDSPIVQLDVRQQHRHFITREIPRRHIYPDCNHGTEITIWLDPEIHASDASSTYQPVQEGRLLIEKIVSYWCRDIGFPVEVSVDGRNVTEPEWSPPVEQTIQVGSVRVRKSVIAVDRSDVGVTGFISYHTSDSHNRIPVRRDVLLPRSGPETWVQEEISATERLLLQTGILFRIGCMPSWVGNAIDDYIIDVRKPAILTPLLNRTGVKEDEHLQLVRDTVAEALLQHIEAITTTDPLEDPIAQAIKVAAFAMPLIDFASVKGCEPVVSFLRRTPMCIFIRDGKPVLLSLKDLESLDEDVLYVNWPLYATRSHNYSSTISLHRLLSQREDTAAFAEFLLAEVVSKSHPSTLVCSPWLKTSMIIDACLDISGFRPHEMVSPLPPGLGILKLIRDEHTECPSQSTTFFPEWETPLPFAYCFSFDFSSPTGFFGVNRSSPVGVQLAVLSEISDAAVQRAVRDTLIEIEVAFTGRHGPSRPNVVMAQLWDLAYERTSKCVIEKSEFCFGLSDIPEMTIEEFTEIFVSEYADRYHNWIAEHGGQLPEELRKAF